MSALCTARRIPWPARSWRRLRCSLSCSCTWTFQAAVTLRLGVGRILGYDLIENFRAPFEATSFSELWNRWHISMTSWFRDYIYFPMGGSRCNLVRRSLNVIIVFTVSGLWHGAEWQYLLWGLICGVISAVGARHAAGPQSFVAAQPALPRRLAANADPAVRHSSSFRLCNVLLCLRALWGRPVRCLCRDAAGLARPCPRLAERGLP